MIKERAGFTLLEILIALLVLSIGLLGLAMLQTRALACNMSSTYRAQATNLASFIIDSMRVNRTSAVAGAYNSTIPTPLTSCVSTVSSISGTIAAQDLLVWRNLMACTLPSGTGSITQITNTTTFTILVRWEDNRCDQSASASLTTSFSTSTDL
ncbi:type IV pilus assembly protein PilV [Gammaproteobacteria bacterium]